MAPGVSIRRLCCCVLAIRVHPPGGRYGDEVVRSMIGVDCGPTVRIELLSGPLTLSQFRAVRDALRACGFGRAVWDRYADGKVRRRGSARM